MLEIEHQILTRNNIDGGNELIICHERFLRQAAVFLLFCPERGFLLEKRTSPGKSFFGRTVIPGGNIENQGEGAFPLWAAQRECLEEIGVFPKNVAALPLVADSNQRCILHPFLFVGSMTGEPINREPEKNELVWKRPEEVFAREGINPALDLPQTTQAILLSAKLTMSQYGMCA